VSDDVSRYMKEHNIDFPEAVNALAVERGLHSLPIRYDAMCRAIDAAYEVDEVKDIRDKAIAFEVYARQARNTEAERRACEIRLRAERKAGQLLIGMEKAKGAQGSGSNQHEVRSHDTTAPTLRDLGITKQQSSNWQRLADVPQEQFDAALADATQKPSTAGIIRAADMAPENVPVSAEALWLWGRILDFRRNGMLGREPSDVLLTMTPEMLDDVHTLAPQVVSWLERIGEPL
jgi:hypothetical protein